jgi:hypothetical protein
MNSINLSLTPDCYAVDGLKFGYGEKDGTVCH